MPTTYQGGCQCGAIRYEITAEPMMAGHCQCLDCQHETGGGHASFLAFPADAVKLTGTPRFYEVKADNGNTMRRGFCPTCGSPVVAARAACRTCGQSPPAASTIRASSNLSSSSTRCGVTIGISSTRRYRASRRCRRAPAPPNHQPDDTPMTLEVIWGSGSPTLGGCC